MFRSTALQHCGGSRPPAYQFQIGVIMNEKEVLLESQKWLNIISSETLSDTEKHVIIQETD